MEGAREQVVGTAAIILYNSVSSLAEFKDKVLKIGFEFLKKGRNVTVKICNKDMEVLRSMHIPIIYPGCTIPNLFSSGCTYQVVTYVEGVVHV